MGQVLLEFTMQVLSRSLLVYAPVKSLVLFAHIPQGGVMACVHLL